MPRFAVRGFNPFTLALFLLLLGALATPAFAQEGTILGSVTDPTGAAVPNAPITITQTDTGQIRHVVTDNAGQYVSPALTIGTYSVRVEAAGFKPIERRLALAVGDRTRLDFNLQVGPTQELVTVEDTAVRVQTDSSEISDVISGQQITELATNGRSIYTLINLTPGASSLQGDFQTPTPVGGDANVSFNGQRPGHNIYLLDGGEDLDRGGAGTFSVMPSLEAISEFRALTSNYSAEYGLSSAATLSTVLKSGTKKFHAEAWEFDRNDALDARNYFNPAPAKVAKLRFNTYGFNLGGPVTFGKLYNPGREKTFFFYNMEWRSLIQGGVLNQTVPLTSTYGGNFSAANLTLAKFHAPFACQLSASLQQQFANAGQALSGCTGGTPNNNLEVPFNNNALPAGLLNANAQALLKAGIFPAPTNGAQFQGGANTPTNVREEVARVDHIFNDKFSIFGHFVAEQISQGFGTTQWSGDNVPTIGDTFGNPSYSGVVHATHSISPTLLNEVAFNYNGNRINIIPNGLVTAPSGFTFNRVFTGPNASTRIPSINLNGSTGANYTANWTPWVNKADDYQIRDDISWVSGKHQLKFGASWALYKKIQDVFASTQGSFGFNGFYTGNDFADFLLGYAQSYSEDAVKDNGHWNNVSWAAYFQDNWRLNNRLTLNLGLRWDGVPHTYEANNRMSNFYPNLYDPTKAPIFNADGTISTSSPALGTSPNPILQGYQFYLNGIGISGQPGIPRGMVEDKWLNFGPRIGFAYDLTGRGDTVLRGGFGTMYERIQGNDMYDAATDVPFSASASLNNVLLSNPKTNIQTGNTIVTPPLPIIVPSITGQANGNYKLPVVYQYSFGVQQSLGRQSVISVAYVGSQSRHQSDFREIELPNASLLPGLVNNSTGYNQLLPFLGFHSIRLANDEASGHYNSLQTDVHGRIRNDLTVQVGYTLSRAIDPSTGGGNGFDLDNVSNPYLGWKYDQGPSIFDRTNVAFVNFVYEIPFLKNSDNRLLKSTVGGWTFSGIVTMESGAPLNITQGGTNVCSVVPNCANRPDLTGSISYPHTVAQWFNTSAFTAPAQGTWGNLPHDALRGPGRDNWNLSLAKSFLFSESRGSRLEFRADAFNAWNHTQFKGDVQEGGISTSTTSSTFGQITSAFDPRTFQLGMKLIF
ncbi:MAG: TonB-dependent receptor [Acidobacteria bacterium]|nr:TonB-dependent receptor [Acidobacteriota bacterium]MBV9147021.1 TonB-dependent receptor [Acidobacteriota bacterium]